MKVVFVGPSLPDARNIASASIDLRPPAAKGDIYRAVVDGAQVIGLVDGYFEHTAAIWHKEILFALSQGVTVFGAASMGALRACECATFGMIGIGAIFEGFVAGDFIDDSDVAQIHGPAELGYIALSEPLVNVVFTVRALSSEKSISPEEADALIKSAESLFFKERNWRRTVLNAEICEERREQLHHVIATRKINQKRLDASEMISRIDASAHPAITPRHWEFRATSHWRAFVQSR